eukprot:832099_1
MAKAIEAGAKEAGAEVKLRQVPETLPDEVIGKLGATEAKKAFQDVPIATNDDLVEADAIIFGTPTRFGNMAAQMKAFLDATGGLWFGGKLVGKVGSVFTSSAGQHGGQESTILSFHVPLLHHGMVIVGIPPSAGGVLTKIDEVQGCSFYGASTIVGTQGERMPSEGELEAA